MQTLNEFAADIGVQPLRKVAAWRILSFAKGRGVVFIPSLSMLSFILKKFAGRHHRKYIEKTRPITFATVLVLLILTFALNFVAIIIRARVLPLTATSRTATRSTTCSCCASLLTKRSGSSSHLSTTLGLLIPKLAPRKLKHRRRTSSLTTIAYGWVMEQKFTTAQFRLCEVGSSLTWVG